MSAATLAGTSPARRGRGSRGGPAGGFTLIEIMVVLVIAATLMAIATLSLGGLPARGAVDGELLRLEARLGLASQRAVLEGRELGIAFSRRGYAFAAHEDGAWWPMGDALLARRAFEPGLAVELRVEGGAVLLPDALPGAGDAAGRDGAEEPEAPVPQVLVLSDGTVTAFDLGVRHASSGRSGWLQVSLLGDAHIVHGDREGTTR